MRVDNSIPNAAEQDIESELCKAALGSRSKDRVALYSRRSIRPPSNIKRPSLPHLPGPSNTQRRQQSIPPNFLLRAYNSLDDRRNVRSIEDIELCRILLKDPGETISFDCASSIVVVWWIYGDLCRRAARRGFDGEEAVGCLRRGRPQAEEDVEESGGIFGVRLICVSHFTCWRNGEAVVDEDFTITRERRVELY